MMALSFAATVGILGAALPSFQDCYWGVYTEYNLSRACGMSVYSSENFMQPVPVKTGMGTAYRVDRSGYMEVHIHDNRLDTRRDGIVLVMNDGAAYVLVEHNDILFARNLPPGQYTKGYYGIRVFEANTLNLNSKIQNNTIRYRQGASTAYGGIGLVSARAFLVANNTMLMTDNASNYVGILLHGCENADVKCNDVHGANNGYLHLGQAGIRNWMGTAPLISCNTVDRTTNGILFSGYGLNVDVKGNEFNNHRWGLHLEYGGQIGTQDLKGNLWLEAAPANGYQAWHENATDAQEHPITYELGVPFTLPPQRQPLNWFEQLVGTTFNCYQELGECAGYKLRCDSCLNEIYGEIATDSLQNGIYTDPTRWTMKGDLYQKLKEAPVLLQDATMQAFYDSVQTTVAAQLKDLDDERLLLFGMDSTVLDQLQLNREQLETLRTELGLALEQLAQPGSSEALMLALQGSIAGLQVDLAELVAYNTAALDLAATSRALSAESVKQVNEGIGASALMEQNYKTVNAVYLNTVAKDVDGFTVQQAQDLFTVANQCPLTGGNAVFLARALYYLVDPEQDFDDPLLCLQEGLVTKSLKQDPVTSITIVPNPATDDAYLLLAEEWDDPSVFILTDALGAEVFRRVLPAHTLRYAFSTVSLAPAVYHYQVRGPSGVVCHGKLSIVH